jgi:hypothetical protein
VARVAYLRGNRLDVILVTGDLATTGDARDLRPAHEFVDAAPVSGRRAPWLTAAGKPTLQAAGAPIVLLPGNHDRYQGLTKNAGGTQFDAFFANYWKTSSRGQLPASPSVQTLVVLQGGTGEKLAIVAADFTLATNADADASRGGWFAYLGQSKAYQVIVDALKKETADQRNLYSSLAVVCNAFPTRVCPYRSHPVSPG